ncbi:CHASE domain-containing protein [Sulfurimonas sp.]|uniref:CHASE domain-containing sensor histidine kinase n=1 Tax=Sulfurimonas sp. TaxID=2022749 RepID=UPI002620D6F3|nr:CHASE domain-containing protein [Sulfurimonas sp.]MDD3854315.1 CHASE domain-containing protein [Sulfurimonas sp.]
MNELIRIKNRIFKIMPFVSAIIFFAITYQYYWAMKNSAYAKLQAEFSFKSKEIKRLIEGRILSYEQVLNGAKGLFMASESITREEFKTYVAALKLDLMFPGIQGVGFSVIVPPSKRDDFIKKIRAEGIESFDITPMNMRDFYTSIVYLEPFNERNKRAIGYDMFSEENRREAMQSARDKNSVAISGKVTLLQEYDNNTQSGFLMYLPIFDKSIKNETLQERREHIKGWVYAPFRINNFMHGLNEYENNDFDIEIYDNGVVSKKSLMYDRFANNEKSLYSSDITINVAGRNWTLLIKSTPIFEAKVDLEKANILLLAGAVFSLFLFYIFWQMVNIKEYAQKRTQRANNDLLINKNKLSNLNKTLEKRVEDKTKELQIANERQEEYIFSLEILNLELKKSKENALQAAQARSNFISSISHELRTPLNSIINFTDQTIEDFDEMLLDKDLQDDTKNYLRRVLANSKHLLQLINDLLEFTKAEAGKIDYTLEKVDINIIMTTAYNNTYSLLNGTDIQFNLKLNQTPLIAMIDSRRFLQILLNLLSNAIKFTKKGSIELRSFDDANYISIEIEDTGKGIAIEKQKAIFEPFIQADSNDSGTGLGLGLVQRMCDDMGIEISLNSQEGMGSVFRLNIKKVQV